MMTQFAQLYPYGLIRYTQTSFLELVTDTEVHRIDFVGKLTWRLQRGTHGPLSFHHDHPMLSALHIPLTTLMARATPDSLPQAPALLHAIRQELYTHQDKWYDFYANSWTRCWQHLSHYNIRPDLTRTGGIILNQVPIPIAQAVAAICSRYDVDIYYLPPPELASPPPPASPFELLLIGQNYVIAREFIVSTLYGNPSAKLPPRFLKKSR
ncbi:hypothetical protein [Hymenobacter glacieicola]|uniref:WbqC-like protein n=1 Tax=Hymenobacter glacieicola TaxID=1562124 RepID=A0ABQ1WKS5_9BACT|nr:hypothetical protein [Hymenobacter glacieicola]GGG35800.1 hypothetical protein GCM10011378_10080 [Hymenobacter glacieicola]